MNTYQSRCRLLIATSLFGAIFAFSNLTFAAKKAEDARGLQPVALAIPGVANPIPLYGESHALVIGAADYNHGWPRLPGVTSDIEAVSKALVKQGFAVTQVKNPTGDKLDKTLRRFVSQYGQKKDSRLLIYYAGHGHTLKPDEERQLGYLVPVDAPLADRDLGGFKETALSMEVIESYAKQIESKHALFVFDACFSGSFFKMRAAPELIALKTTRPVRQFITSGSADQMVPDVSMFRRQFIAGLGGEADYNRDGYVTGSELGSFLEDKVTNYSNRTQTPQYGKIRDPALDKGDFVFVLNRPDSKSIIRDLPISPSGMNMDDLQQEGRARQSWVAWQSKMQTDFDKVAALTGGADLQTRAWERFLQTYAQDNPYGQEDEDLRADAKTRLEAARQKTTNVVDGGERVRPSAPTRPSTDALKPGEVFRDCPHCPDMMVIPAGKFKMGSNTKAFPEDNSTMPVQIVHVSSFALGKTEVTQGQWRALMGNNPSKFSNCGNNCPVENVNWFEAQEYVRKLSALTGKKYRLPSESEWEYSCRAGEQLRYCGSDNLDIVGWYGAYDKGNSERTTNPVGQKQANAWGVYDMSGNVYEWLEDCYHDSYLGAPTDGRAWQGRECSYRVLRGGAWYSSPDHMRPFSRLSSDPMKRNSFYQGIRVARNLQ